MGTVKEKRGKGEGKLPAVQRAWVRRMGERKVIPMALEQIRPFIRIAHAQVGRLRIGTRVIVDHELVLFTAGAGRVTVGGEAFAFTAPALFFIGPFVPNAFECDLETTRHLAIHFDFAAGIPAFSTNLTRRKPYQVLLPHELSISAMGAPTGEVIEGMEEIVALQSCTRVLAKLQATALLLQVLTTLMRAEKGDYEAGGNARIPRPKIERAILFMERGYAGKISLSALVGAAGLSRAHFNRLFVLHTGYAPMEYLRRHRIQVARRLLADVDLSIKEIAHRTGFPDALHFSKTFRQIDGVPPTDYRAALLAGEVAGAGNTAIH